MAGRGPYRRWPHEQVAIRYLPVIDQSTGAGFDPSGSWVATPRPLARYQGRPQWQQRFPQLDVSTSASFDPPDLPRQITPPPPPPRPWPRALYEQTWPKLDQPTGAGLDPSGVRAPTPRGQPRVRRPRPQQ